MEGMEMNGDQYMAEQAPEDPNTTAIHKSEKEKQKQKEAALRDKKKREADERKKRWT
jgi:hypothetical protein